jgi:hypothetical protein
MSRTTAIPSHTRCVPIPLRCVYADVDRVLRDELGARALEACRRADVEVVVIGTEAVAQELGLRSWIDGEGLVLDGERQDADDPVAAHMRARGYTTEETIRVDEGSFYEAVITELMTRR